MNVWGNEPLEWCSKCTAVYCREPCWEDNLFAQYGYIHIYNTHIYTTNTRVQDVQNFRLLEAVKLSLDPAWYKDFLHRAKRRATRQRTVALVVCPNR